MGLRSATGLATWRRLVRNLRAVAQYRLPRRTALLAGIAYVLIYLYSIDTFQYDPRGGYAFLTGSVVDDWPAKIWRLRTAYLWEPIGSFTLLPTLRILLGIPNLLLGAVLGVLLAVNVAVATYSLTAPRVCRTRGSLHGIVGSLPSFLTGFACCAPTAALTLLSVNVALVSALLALREFLIPVSIVAMVGAVLWGAHRIQVFVDLLGGPPR